MTFPYFVIPTKGGISLLLVGYSLNYRCFRVLPFGEDLGGDERLIQLIPSQALPKGKGANVYSILTPLCTRAFVIIRFYYKLR
jgi:hypothetical protein